MMTGAKLYEVKGVKLPEKYFMTRLVWHVGSLKSFDEVLETANWFSSLV